MTPDTSRHRYEIRTAEPSDLPAILSLMREMAEFEQLTHLFQASEASLRESFFGPSPAAHCLLGHVAGSPGSPVAYAMWFHNYSSFLDKRGLYLEDLYVQPAHRGGGLGSLVLSRLARIAIERDCGRFEWVVLDWNRNAIDFYRRHGAEVLDEWRIVRMTGDALRRLAG